MHGKIIPAITQPFACQWCGKEYWIPASRVGRPSKFCGDLCRQKQFRDSKRLTPSDPTGCHENPPETAAIADACKRVFPDRPPVDKALWRRIVEAERGWTGGREVVSSDGVRGFIVRERPRR
jgi:hypothetical protein